MSVQTPNTDPYAQENIAVESAAAYAYDAAGVEYGVEPDLVARERLCHPVARFMVGHLTTVEGLNAVPDNRGYHNYVELPSGRIADGTWQQFLPSDAQHSEHPRVLVGTRDEVVDYARKSGVHEGDLRLWQQRKPRAGNPLQIVVPPGF